MVTALPATAQTEKEAPTFQRYNMAEGLHIPLSNNWPGLFPEILIEIISYLTLEDRFCTSKVCRAWRDVVKRTPVIWQILNMKIVPRSSGNEEKDLKQGINKKEFISFLCDHCHLISNLILTVAQKNPEYVQYARRVLRRLSLVKGRRLSCFKLIFANENPLFYSGKDFLDILVQLFECPRENCLRHEHLTSVDLSKFPVCLDNKLLYTLAEHHGTHLSDVKLQNYSLVCNISKDCIHDFARACNNLKFFSIHMSCVDGETLRIFGASGRQPIEILSFFCQREDKYTSDIASDDWLFLSTAFPNLRVIMYFDHTCPIFRVEEILKPVIPISVLKLRLLATVTEMIYFVANSYSQTLEVFDVTTTPSTELDAAILYLAMHCGKLRELHVWCRLSKSVVDSIVSLHTLEKHTLDYNIDCEN